MYRYVFVSNPAYWLRAGGDGRSVGRMRRVTVRPILIIFKIEVNEYCVK